MIKLIRTMLLAVALAGCNSHDKKSNAPGEEEHDHEHEGADDHHEEESHGAPEGSSDQTTDVELVRVDPSMLRDLRITTSPAEARPSGEAVTALGELRVNEETYAEVGVPSPARVLRVLVAPGAVVRAGQPLVQLESVELGRARAELLAANPRIELARQTLARKQSLAAEQIVPLREVQQAEADLAAAEASVRAAQTQVGTLGGGRGGGGRFELSSPIAGTVLERSALQGQMVDPSQPLFRIGDLSRLWAVVRAFERDAVRVRPGVRARVMLPALPGQTFVGTVTYVGTQVDLGSRTVEVRIELENTNGVLRPGMSGTAHVPIGDPTETVIAVPSIALQRMPQGWSVFIPRGASVFEARHVGRGRDLGGEVEIVNGLRVGERVVVDGAFLLRAESEKGEGGGDHHH